MLIPSCPNVDRFNCTIIICNGNTMRRKPGPSPGMGGCRNQAQPAPRSLHFATFLHNLLKNLRQSSVHRSRFKHLNWEGKYEVCIENTLIILDHPSILYVLTSQAPFPEPSLLQCPCNYWRNCSLPRRSLPPHCLFTFEGWEFLQLPVFAQIEAGRAVPALLLHNLGSP